MATRIYCSFYIFYYVAPIFVALLADNWLGHYNTMAVSFVIYCLGIVVLTVSAAPVLVTRGWGLPGLVIAMILIGLGAAGVGFHVFLPKCGFGK
jgi:proton-dependent oligopeptide transporter, POT family